MAKCEACGNGEAVYHVTVTVTVAGPKTTRQKLAQFWLCEECELLNRRVLARDHGQAHRVARLLCTVPEYV